MPNGTYVIDTRQTFTAVFLMACGPKMRFGTSEQDITANGERKWEARCAVTFTSEYGMRSVSDVIPVVIAAGADPCATIPPGSPVEFDSLRVGFSTPEKGDNGRVRGGKPWYSSPGIRAARPVPAGKSE